MRERLKDEDKRAIRALELDGLTQRQLLQRLTKLIAEMDRLANEDDPTAGPLAEWAPAARAMFGNLTKPELVPGVSKSRRPGAAVCDRAGRDHGGRGAGACSMVEDSRWPGRAAPGGAKDQRASLVLSRSVSGQPHNAREDQRLSGNVSSERGQHRTSRHRPQLLS
jgi:hypothetical protein